jgi:hypothetical protein
MEAWKVLLLVAAIPTLLAAVFSYQNYGTLKEKTADRERQKGRVENARNQLERAKEELAKTEADTRALDEESETLRGQLAALKAQVSEQELKIQSLNDEIAAADKKIASFDELKKIFGEIDKINMQIATVNEEIATLEGNLANVENLLAVASAKKRESETQIERMEAMAKYRRSGTMWRDINTKVKAAYNDWGFVIIGAGDVDGLVPAATLDVTRQGRPICKLLVTEVEVDQATAEIIIKTLLPGQTVQVGDTVTKKATVTLP